MCTCNNDLLLFHRSGENSRPFTIASFEEDDEDAEKEEQDDSINLDTSDYHSATSSDCSSTASSDTEEEAKDEEKEDDKKEAVKKEAEGDTYTIMMVPRIRKRPGEGANKVKYVRNMVIVFHFFLSLSIYILLQNEVCIKRWFQPILKKIFKPSQNINIVL